MRLLSYYYKLNLCLLIISYEWGLIELSQISETKVKALVGEGVSFPLPSVNLVNPINNPYEEIAHNTWDSEAKYKDIERIKTSPHHDFCIVTLEDRHTGSVPLCLPKEPHNDFNKKVGKTYGFGYKESLPSVAINTNNLHRMTERKIAFMDFQVIPTRECIKKWDMLTVRRQIEMYVTFKGLRFK